MASGPARTGPFISQSGRNYNIKRVLQEETDPPHQVYIATADNQTFVLKYIHPANFDDLNAVNNKLHGYTSHIRLAKDIIPERSMFVFEYFADHLLHLAQMNLPPEVMKRILKDALRGLAELHDQDVVHTDIKADNVFTDYQSATTIERVQLGDLEDAVYIPLGSSMVGKRAGNWMWRSPEAHAKGRVNKPSDIFSFALVCIYAMHKRVIFAVGDDELEEGVDPLAVVVERQVSYFADEDGLKGLLEYLRDNPWVQVFEVIRDGFNKDNPRRPFSLWSGVDNDFKHLICAMTNFDPRKRITAREALAHKWFADV
ncbi:hypothetical protein ASPCADRAFT_8030 [Aspergillus carbonarius ITEM 5010]|uniref:Protein kinase domain-containing protein n=1 Tax=Aspergillus carbonarius (strain ITEM 5010) TaxID=602072 RepID=A0A1R3RF27_ASPC5|nr:hypothetical protein ASPCADRAFT_8030 [Aspergillus carbonarius ITEM 5010]